MHRRESGGEAAAAGELEGWLDEDALLLSNTSSLSLDDLAAPLRHPERFAGLHFLAISAAAEPPKLLVDAERYGGLYEWTADDQARLERVRADALELGAAVAKRRPRPSPRASA